MGETLENHAARVLQSLRPGVPADAALRDYLARNRSLGAIGKRSVSRGVFAYFRWLNWLEPAQSLQKQVVGALALQARFDRDPACIKVAALAARAVPSWLAGQMDVSAGFLRSLQREPSLWIRAKAGAIREVEAALGSCDEPVLPESVPAPPGSRPCVTAGRRTSTRRQASSRAHSRSRTSHRSLWATPARPSPARPGGTHAPERAARRFTSRT